MIEKIKAEIERRMKDTKDHQVFGALNEIYSFIESLEKEQCAGETMMEKDKIDTAFTRMMEKENRGNSSKIPSNSPNVDEAFRSYMDSSDCPPANLDEERMAFEAYKAGVKFQAEQGYIREVEVKEDAGGYPYINEIELYDYDNDKPLAKKGDKVRIQITKVE